MQQSSGTIQINLSTIRSNWSRLRDTFSGDNTGAVIKANAYGLGLPPVAQALYSEGCRDFFVANYEEGLDVQKILPSDIRVYILQGCPEGLELTFVDKGLIPILHSYAMCTRWLEANVVNEGGGAISAIKVNTGMNRLGVSPTELEQLCESGLLNETCGVEILFSHLACADEPEHPLNQQQLQQFSTSLVTIQKMIPSIRGSFTNSAGVFLGESWHFDLARPGIGLYGVGLPAINHPLKSAVSLFLKVLQTRYIEEGESIGYGAKFVAKEKTRIAVVSGGYADGIIRAASCNAEGWFHQKLPLLGIVSMDSCVFDISALPEHLCPKEGDEIELFGEQCPIDELAQRASTIGYELLTGLGMRFQKRYVE